ncbi:fructose-2,6-bisphosphatase SKDI_10G0630 [Saccharomyces kudriavzevii IFO 1802]|uniref:fructose-2,6-bisphosphate 2-phosphatase n=1 Tax=Saccharomyces kudriavzevii (strain ATCC MYA-4449 / AS 2.2408 / CBS 8840 / NBRC 1802 / NCYC 2889) TaxID=226230 RepID=A0AA35NJ28_SACK1|nr:uncharacterized protein SKDI_10G0630 [Saccharomyces kudriavzevii IFO 1802]CAI4043532.1 hypothetical protein SKDI_10G0630 [Saccharomyces kudriavzevii IFO 1802]
MGFSTISNDNDIKVCVIMVGLPARGKSFISQKIIRYLSWLSIKAKCFNVGNYRRDVGGNVPIDAEFFNFENVDGFKLRELAAQNAMKDIVDWFAKEGGTVAVFDATNSTRERRKWLKDVCEKNNIQPMFLESWSDDHELIANNAKDIGSTSPDYKGFEPEVAEADFLNRIGQYERFYEPLDAQNDRDMTFVKLINIVEEVVINKIRTYLESRIVFYVMNIRPKPKFIWLSRHGESIYNVEKKIGGDSSLSERGFQYAKKLKHLVKESAGEVNLTVWTSTLKRTQQTAKHLPYKKLQWKALDELDAGVCDGMTYEEIEKKYPEDFKARDNDKYEYRYRGGESYRDVVIRLEPVIMELERQENVLIITHQAVLRCIYAYFMNVPQEESPWMSIPLHTLIKLEPRAYGTKVTKIKANIPAVSTYKEKGTSQVGELSQNSTKLHQLLNDSPLEDKF